MDSGFNTELHFWSKVSLDVEVKGRGCMCCSSQGELINWLSYVILCPFSYIIIMTVFIFEVCIDFLPHLHIWVILIFYDLEYVWGCLYFVAVLSYGPSLILGASSLFVLSLFLNLPSVFELSSNFW